MSPNSSAVLPPLLASVDRPSPPILRLEIAAGFLTGIGGGNPASESSLSLYEDSDLGFFLASMRTYISPISSAVFPPLFARVDRPRPPIFRFEITAGFFIGIGGGKPASESSLSDRDDSDFGLFFASCRTYISPISSAVLPPLFASVDKPRPPIFRLGIAIGFLIGMGGGNPASESVSEFECDDYDFGFFLASYKTYISANSSAVLPSLFARVDKPKPPIFSTGSAIGFLTGIGGGNPASESDVSD